MKKIAVIALGVLCGCAAQKNAPVATGIMPPMPAATMPANSTVKELVTAMPLQPRLLRLTWNCGYVATNEQTAIEESTNLVDWVTIFTGATNEYFAAMDKPCGFFRAYNFLVNP